MIKQKENIIETGSSLHKSLKSKNSLEMAPFYLDIVRYFIDIGNQ
jgi:hypothetical protein